MNPALSDPAAIHPTLWRGNQLARGLRGVVSSGDTALDAALPGGGWPMGEVIDLLVTRPGIGEMRLLRPALAAVATRPLMLLCPPHVPNALAFAHWGLPAHQCHWIEADNTADVLWAADQILRAGTCGALLLWQNAIRSENIRRLQLSAQRSTTLFFLLRPSYAADAASPAGLRIALYPAEGGIEARILKRRGPALEHALHIPLTPQPFRSTPFRTPAEVPLEALDTMR